MTEPAGRGRGAPSAGRSAPAVGVLALAVSAGLAALVLPASAWGGEAAPRLGLPIAAEVAARADPTVFADGRGLPPGQGSVGEGRVLYEQHCTGCHGPDGRGGNSGRLARAASSASPSPGRPADRTIAAFWPYATTLFDYIRRAMPIDRPGSLGDQQVYGLTAYLLALDGLVAPDAVLSAATLPAVRMPNRDGFLRMEPPGAR
jgi:mono/diheme cytochrome c family protein